MGSAEDTCPVCLEEPGSGPTEGRRGGPTRNATARRRSEVDSRQLTEQDRQPLETRRAAKAEWLASVRAMEDARKRLAMSSQEVRRTQAKEAEGERLREVNRSSGVDSLASSRGAELVRKREAKELELARKRESKALELSRRNELTEARRAESTSS